MSAVTLRTDAEVAVDLHKSRRWVREFVRARGLPHSLAGRTMLFEPADIARIREALRSRSTSASEVTSGTRAARSASGLISSPSGNSAQERVRAKMRKLLQRDAKPRSARTYLAVLPGGRAASP